MLSRGDVFRCSGGRCVFLKRGRAPFSVNDKLSIELPRVRVSSAAACVMAEKLLLPLHCVIEPIITEQGFEFHFRSGINIPATQRAPTELILWLEEIHSWLNAARERDARGTHIDDYLNDGGRRVFAWFFSAIYNEAYFVASSEVRVTWHTSNVRRLPSSPPTTPTAG